MRPLIRPIVTIAEARLSRFITRYVVSTDDPDIQQVARDYGAEAPFLRPSEYATDTTSSVTAQQHAVNWVERGGQTRYDYVIELMCTNPMKTVVDIDAVIEKLLTKPK